MAAPLRLGGIDVEYDGSPYNRTSADVHVRLTLWTPSGQPRHVELTKRDLLQIIKDATQALARLDDVRLR